MKLQTVQTKKIDISDTDLLTDLLQNPLNCDFTGI